jgi:hypothetical protein
MVDKWLLSGHRTSDSSPMEEAYPPFHLLGGSGGGEDRGGQHGGHDGDEEFMHGIFRYSVSERSGNCTWNS